MDNREAKFILSAYRPGGQDASDSRFSEALEQARRDPMLEQWLRDSVTFDAAITERLSAVEPPPDLRENILAGVKVSRVPHWKNRLRKWTIAAALILGATLGSLIWHNARPAHLAGWQNAALEVISSLVRNETSFDAQSGNPSELLTWLRTNQAPATKKLPNDLGKLSSVGCKTFSWNGTPVSVICFVRKNGELIHLVTINARATVDRTRRQEANLVQRGGWATATWREGDRVYMLALKGSRDQLRSYLL
ncbi:MAG: hypothetical protein DMF41_12370 [Verrucomicrobia bacterium]|nr:MAG: hypothetical protein DMF41_12370 [Verrucomicrobiota bacterium]